MTVTSNSEFVSWINYLKVYQRGMCDFWKLNIPSLSTVFETLDKCPRAGSLEDIRGKKLLVMGESGYGDHIWFYRYLIELNKVCDLTLFCPEVVVPLMQGIRCITDFPFNIEDYDCYIWLFDFLHLMDNLGCTGRYLNVPYKELLPRKKDNVVRIGFALGNADTPLDMKDRCVEPSVMNYFMLDNIEVYNFSDINNYFCKNNIFPLLKSFILTCQYIQEMDFMVCSDNVNLHLAGALGKKVYGLFMDKHQPVWFDLPNSSAWYDSIKVIMIHPLDRPRDIAEKIRREESLV